MLQGAQNSFLWLLLSVLHAVMCVALDWRVALLCIRLGKHGALENQDSNSLGHQGKLLRRFCLLIVLLAVHAVPDVQGIARHQSVGRSLLCLRMQQGKGMLLQMSALERKANRSRTNDDCELTDSNSAYLLHKLSLSVHRMFRDKIKKAANDLLR